MRTRAEARLARARAALMVTVQARVERVAAASVQAAARADLPRVVARAWLAQAAQVGWVAAASVQAAAWAAPAGEMDRAWLEQGATVAQVAAAAPAAAWAARGEVVRAVRVSRSRADRLHVVLHWLLIRRRLISS